MTKTSKISVNFHSLHIIMCTGTQITSLCFNAKINLAARFNQFMYLQLLCTVLSLIKAHILITPPVFERD